MAVQYYNRTRHSSTGFALVTVHLGIERNHPEILTTPGQEADRLDYSNMDACNKQMSSLKSSDGNFSDIFKDPANNFKYPANDFKNPANNFKDPANATL